MKTKTKILIAAFALIFVVGVALTSVWALTAINPQASFKVTFLQNLRDVHANVKMASYLSSSENPVETLEPVVIDGTVVANETVFTKQIVVTGVGQVVSYVFEIENTTTKDSDNDLIVEPVLTSDSFSNISTEFLYSIDGVTYNNFTSNYVVVAKDSSVYFKVESKANSVSTSNKTLNGNLNFNFYSELDDDKPTA